MVWVLMPDARLDKRKAAVSATSSVRKCLLAEDGLFGEEIAVDIAGDAGRGRGLQQTGGHGVETDAGKG